MWFDDKIYRPNKTALTRGLPADGLQLGQQHLVLQAAVSAEVRVVAPLHVVEIRRVAAVITRQPES